MTNRRRDEDSQEEYWSKRREKRIRIAETGVPSMWDSSPSESDEEIKSSLEVESKKRGRSQSFEVGVCQPSSSIDEVADLDTSVGRRSTRTRKPVERFTIVLSDREDEGRLHFSMINNISYLVSISSIRIN